MQHVSKAEVVDLLKRHASLGSHIDQRLQDAVSNTTRFYQLVLEDEESFLSLLWQEIDGVRLVTRNGRTVRDVAKLQWSFAELASPQGFPLVEHDPKWFEPCIAIDAEFNYSRFGPLAVQSMLDRERQRYPEATFYIFDGCHRALVLAAKLLRNQIAYQPVTALLIAR